MLAVLDFEGLDQLEVEQGFGVDGDVAVAGEACAAGACGCADEAADQSAFAAAGETADECAAAGAAAGECGGALAFAGAGFGRSGGLDLVGFILHGNIGKSERKDGAAFEAAGGLGVFHDARSVGALWNCETAVDGDGSGDGGGEG